MGGPDRPTSRPYSTLYRPRRGGMKYDSPSRCRHPSCFSARRDSPPVVAAESARRPTSSSPRRVACEKTSIIIIRGDSGRKRDALSGRVCIRLRCPNVIVRDAFRLLVTKVGVSFLSGAAGRHGRSVAKVNSNFRRERK